MKPIVDFILEHIETVNESIASSIVQKWREGRHRFYTWDKMMKEFQWDKITDEDLVWHDQAEAQKLAYKRNEKWILFWVNNDDTLLGWSTSNYSWNYFDTGFYKFKTVKAMSNVAKGAYSLDEKFGTAFLKAARAKARENALALRSNESIAQENIKRYEKILKDMRVKNGSIFADMQARFDELTLRYKEVFDFIQFNEGDENFTEKLRKISDISDRYAYAVEELARCSEQYDKEKEGRAYFSTLNEKIKDANETVQKFLTMYKV